MTGRHAKRTTVTLHRMRGRDEPGWRIDYATFDRPTNPFVTSGPGARLRALNEAHAFEQAKARARFIEANRKAPRVEPEAPVVPLPTEVPDWLRDTLGGLRRSLGG